MGKKSIKKITLTRLIQVFLLSMLVIVAVVTLSYRSFFQFVVENKVLSVAEIIKAGLTSHMKAGIMDKREYFLEEISSVHDIKSIKIVRGDAVSKEYGNSTIAEKKLNNTLRDILDKKEVYIKWNDINSTVEGIVPYIANSNGRLNCLECHHVKDGEVLGAVNIIMDTGLYQNFVFRNTYTIVGILFLFALIVILNMFHVIERYIRKPLSDIIHDGELAYNSHQDISNEKYESKEFDDVVENVNKFNSSVLQKEQELQEKNIELQRLNEEIESTLKETMLAVGQIEEMRSGDTKCHTKRVAKVSAIIAKAYGMDEEQIKLIELASPLHDIGKIGIADVILNKPKKLSEDEYSLMKEHATMGYDILRHSERQVLRTAATIAYEHHEKYDGTGYPQGLKGDEINIFARIVAIVDVVDALLSKRVYKDAWGVAEVVDLLNAERGKHFDPVLVDIILENLDAYEQIIQEMREKC